MPDDGPHELDPSAPDGRRALHYPDRVRPDSERMALVDMLDLYRTIFIRKAEGLAPDQLATTIGPSTLTLGGLVKHMAYVEDHWFTWRFAGRDRPEPWASAPWADDRDWELNSAVDDAPQDLIDLWEVAVGRSQQVLAGVASLTEESATAEAERGRFSMRWILVHMIEEYARHCGHADLLREAVDGTTGD